GDDRHVCSVAAGLAIGRAGRSAAGAAPPHFRDSGRPGRRAKPGADQRPRSEAALLPDPGRAARPVRLGLLDRGTGRMASAHYPDWGTVDAGRATQSSGLAGFGGRARVPGRARRPRSPGLVALPLMAWRLTGLSLVCGKT